eukprot:9945438-Alexandrium_andersonii.AAC.1
MVSRGGGLMAQHQSGPKALGGILTTCCCRQRRAKVLLRLRGHAWAHIWSHMASFTQWARP